MSIVLPCRSCQGFATPRRPKQHLYDGTMVAMVATPQLTISLSAAKRIRNFDCWVFRDELLAPSAEAIGNGDVVELCDPQGTFLGYAFYSARSHIAARVVSRERTQPIDRALLAHRLAAAIDARRDLTGTDARRLVFSEADHLPGVIVDQYAEYLVLQSRAAGMERWKSTIVDLLRELIHPKGVLERSDKEFREEEGLPALTQVLSGSVPDRIRIYEDELHFWVDPYHGQKTGFYLDQRQTRRLFRDRIHPADQVLDVFAYTGAFGIAAASRGARAVCVEQEESALALAQENAALNGVSDRMEFVTGDAFYWLSAAAKRRERFAWVLLDPPALAKSKAQALKGRQALHHLLVHGLGLLAPKGTLLLSLCTYHLLGLAEEMLRIAAADCGLCVRMGGGSLQAPDHPWILQMPATRYLMSWLAQRDAPSAA